jgi:hypothetical protein
MHEPPIQESAHRAQTGVVSRRAAEAPSSSRMFASYLTDIEQLLDSHRWETALREALDLPRIAVALSDARLRCSSEQVKTWCQQWIRPADAERDAQGLDCERLARSLTERMSQLAGLEAVPMCALRRLQLRRHVRMPPRGFFSGRAANLPPREAETVEMCTALLEAARRWYARSACHDPTVQGNLARLAVLR